ncbi:MAG: hypothetical protein QM802_05725 [Agriterribacter sp.]
MKMYQLLRDNVRSGPYNVEFLKQMNLKEFDLIWIENESIMWKYPSEIAEFKNYAPKATFTEGSRVNFLKERQIRYFRGCFGETDYQHMQVYANMPDAFASDVPQGYEYLVAADNQNRYGGNMFVSAETDQVIINKEATAISNVVADNSYKVLGENQMVDTLETAADHQQFTSVLHISGLSKKKKVEEKAEKSATVSNKKNILSVVTGLWLVASILSYLKP